jgi:hypothetical protein
MILMLSICTKFCLLVTTVYRMVRAGATGAASKFLPSADTAPQYWLHVSLGKPELQSRIIFMRLRLRVKIFLCGSGAYPTILQANFFKKQES